MKPPNYWVIADTHFNHQMLIDKRYRPSNYNSALVFNIIGAMRKNDVLIHLGDVTFKPLPIWDTWLRGWDGVKYLTLGNHDKRGLAWYRAAGWDVACDSFTLKIYGKRILFSHIPQQVDNHDLNIHGHLHDDGHRSMDNEMQKIYSAKHILVSMERTNYQPINLKDLVE